ncbi:MAG: hypothetical protein R2744_01585 [Bacteroidales bacterium]
MDIIKPYVISGNHILNADDLLNLTPGIEVMDGQASIRGRKADTVMELAAEGACTC